MIKPVQDARNIASIADPTLQELASLGIVRSYRRGTTVINEGDIGDTVYVILAGKVKVFVSDDDLREMILGIRGAGEYVGELSISGGVRSASVICLEDCTFSIVTRKTLSDFIRVNPDFAMNMISSLISRVRLATDLVKDLALRDVYERVARLLMQLAVEQADGRLVVSERLSQAEIAKRVGASRDMVNRIFRELSMGNYIKLENGAIILLHKKLPMCF
ncbi:MAG TPA: Crp/Fnr family transcriptional regulator [Burkholderiales bacterium]|nr:Crp/Fnr family transcriptional regulator [Burkholderiales bacterium]